VGTFFCHPLFVAAKGQTMGCCEQWQQAVFCGFVCRHMKWNSFGLLGGIQMAYRRISLRVKNVQSFPICGAAAMAIHESELALGSF